jgi:hypothetical protein
MCTPWDSRGTNKVTLMRPPPVTRHNSPLTASGGFFRAIPARQVHRASRARASWLEAGASRAAAPDTDRGSMAVEAARAAERAADGGARDMRWCPPPVLGQTQAARGAFARPGPARDRGSPRVRAGRALVSPAADVSGHTTPTVPGLQAHPLHAGRAGGPQPRPRAPPRRGPPPACTGPSRPSCGACTAPRRHARAEGRRPSRPGLHPPGAPGASRRAARVGDRPGTRRRRRTQPT